MSRGNSIDITAAIWFFAGRMPALRTFGSALLSVIVVGMGASLGREGPPKQAGAVIANTLSNKSGFSDEQRRLLVACGAGAEMAAAYGVPLGGALFSLEVMRGMLALRLVLPALMTSIIAAAGALLGSAIGQVCALISPNAQPGLFALLGAGAFIAATTQGPISSVVLMIELTGHNRSFIAPLIVAVVIATLIAQTIDPRSIYDARLTHQQLQKRQELRDSNTR